ncbi:MAG TPA: choice-of-anchor D domain-containing protein [Myxococcaceae bacterium]
MALSACGSSIPGAEPSRPAVGSARAALGIGSSADDLRTGWYPTQPALAPPSVSAPDFGQLFVSQLDGQIYAQPLLANGVLFVATETNNIYTLDPKTGTILHQRTLETPWNAADLGCADLAPKVGITGTPVIDTSNPSSVTAYFVTKGYLSGTSGPAGAWMHAVDVPTLAERPNFPVQIQGGADNQSGITFDGTYQVQRPGMLMLGDTVYATFAGHCDIGTYQGWVVGVSSGGALRAMWSAAASFPGAGIWQSGGGPMSDGPSTFIVATGNGDVVTQPTPGKQPPNVLAQAWVRLQVQGNGELQATDFFAPYDAAALNVWDADFGSGGPVGLPDSFGTSSVPHLGVAAGKEGFVYLLNRDDLGGLGEGPGGGDKVVQRIGPYGGVWSRPAVWPGNGGWVYYPTASGGTTSEGSTGNFNVFQAGTDGQGNPTLSLVATAADAFGFGSSAPVVTSNGTADGSALVWTVWMPDGSGQGAQLRAYDVLPINGTLPLRFTANVGTGTKFNPPGIGDGRVYVGTRDGNVYAFGAPVDQPLTASPVNLGTVDLGNSTSGQVVFTARRSVTVTAVSSTSPEFTTGAPTPAFPATLAQGASLTIPSTFTPTQAGIRSTAIVVVADGAPVSAPVTGIGRTPTAVLQIAPLVVSFGGVAVDHQVNGTLTLANVGGAGLVVNSVSSPGTPFSATGTPPGGSTLSAGQSITLTFTFSPTAVGTFSDQVVVDTSVGKETVPLSGSAAVAGNLVLNPSSLQFGSVAVGQSKVLDFQITNSGGSMVTVTKSKPPALGLGFSNTDDLDEGSTIAAGATKTLHVQFVPRNDGQATDHWTINADGDQGLLTLAMTGTGGVDSSKGCSSTGGGFALWPLLSVLPWVLRRRRRAE